MIINLLDEALRHAPIGGGVFYVQRLENALLALGLGPPESRLRRGFVGNGELGGRLESGDPALCGDGRLPTDGVLERGNQLALDPALRIRDCVASQHALYFVPVAPSGGLGDVAGDALYLHRSPQAGVSEAGSALHHTEEITAHAA